MSEKLPKIIYYARDMTFHLSQASSSYGTAKDYIKKRSGKGYIEVFELSGDYYHFVKATWIGPSGKNVSRGTIFGELIYWGLRKDFISFTLGPIVS